MTIVRERIEGVVIGIFLGFDDTSPLVVFPGNPSDVAVPALTLAELSADMIGAEVALLFQGGDPAKPLIVGRIVDPAKKAPSTQVFRDGELVRVVGNERVELRCGKSSITMHKDGRIIIRGTYLTSHASATNRIRGASVNLN